MKKILSIIYFIPLFTLAQQDSVQSGSYNWQQPIAQKNKIASTVLLEGKVHDFEWMQIGTNIFSGSKSIKLKVPVNQEHVIIVKSGLITIHFNDSAFSLTPNSVAVLMPRENYTITNSTNTSSDFYTMKYRSKASLSSKELPAGRSYVKMWEAIEYVPNTIGGGRRDFFNCSTVMQKRFEMHVTTLKEGIKSHEPHTHRAEEIVLIIDGDTEMQIGQQNYKTNAGGFYYLGSNELHAIKNIGTKPSTYFAFQFE